MDRVQHRPGVRLDRDAVVRPERMEIERGHDRGHRGAARLVPADLQPVGALADVVGVVDGPGRQPAQPLVEDLQRFDVGGDGLEHAAALAMRDGAQAVRRQAVPGTSRWRRRWSRLPQRSGFGQLGPPDVEDQDDAQVAGRVLRFMLDAVVEDEQLAILPLPRLVADAQPACRAGTIRGRWQMRRQLSMP